MNAVSYVGKYIAAVFVGEPIGSKPNAPGDETFFTLPYCGIMVNLSDRDWQELGPMTSPSGARQRSPLPWPSWTMPPASITFDYGRQSITFQKNHSYGKRSTFDRVGIWPARMTPAPVSAL